MMETRTSLPRAGRPGLANAVAFEWTKLRSVRSTYWLLVVGAVVIVGLSLLITVGLGSGSVTSTGDSFDAAGVSLLGAWFGQIAFGVLGVLIATSEYATGTIRATLAAVPRRGMLLAAKLVLVGVIAMSVGTLVSLIAFLAGQAVLAGQHRSVGLGDPGSVQAVLSTGSYLAAMGVLGVAVGMLLRHTVAAVLAVLGLGLASTLIASLFPAWLRDHVLDYLPGPVGNRIMATVPAPDLADYVTLVAWVAGSVLVAYVLLGRRDA
jgi:ABC-2 type transport system permease protein